jgi:4-oxalocrotonate tautomerase
MPHVTVKLASGRSDHQKARITDEVAKAVMAEAQCAEASVSVAIEDVEAADWAEKVYKPDILGKWANLYKQPGYNPF